MTSLHEMAISYPKEKVSAFAATITPFLDSFNSTSFTTTTTQLPSTFNEEENRIMKEREREAFYATYNVWTGVRTAITLTLFFLFTVTVILYKSKCKRHRRYELYPSLEEIPGRPLEFYDYWCQTQEGGVENAANCSRKMEAQQDLYCHVFEEGPKDVLGSAPIPTHLDRDSLSSYYNSFQVKSLPGSAMKINFSRMGSYEREEAMQYATASGRQEYLRVPGVRLQSTGSSSDGYSLGSSMYDIPYDTTPLSLLNVPGMSVKHKPMMQTGGIDWEHDQATADWLQTIDINVINPTPNVSPCGSIRSIADHIYDGPQCLSVPSRGRSCSYSSVDSRECDTRSVGSDSVFYESSNPLSDRDSKKIEVRKSNGKVKRTRSLSVAQVHSKKKNGSNENNRRVHSFRLPINPKAAMSPMPELLQGKPLKLSDSLMPSNTSNKTQLATNLNVPLGVHLSTSCERLSTHGALLSEYDNVSRQTSVGTLNQGSSFEDDPVITSFTLPVLRRCNSATTPEVSEEAKSAQFKRADSDTNKVIRSDSAEIRRQTSSSSSGSEEVSDSVSFHLFVPHLSIDCPSADTSRASSPSLSLTPPGSPPYGSSLSVPSPFHRSTSPSRGRVRGIADGRGILKRQFSQYIPSSPREKPPSPFGLPTSFEEDEEAEDENFQKIYRNKQKQITEVTRQTKVKQARKDNHLPSTTSADTKNPSHPSLAVECLRDTSEYETKF